MRPNERAGMPKTRHDMKSTNGAPKSGHHGRRNTLPVVITLCLVLVGLIYFTSQPLLKNFDPMFYRLTSALS